jgi:hypothetical protein
MKYVTVADADHMIVQALGLDPCQYDCGTVEVLAALLRRAASFQCPCSARALVRSVAESLQGLVAGDDLSTSIALVMDELLAYGDLTEVKGTEGGALVYTTPPAFVTLDSGRTLLLGVAPESVDWLPAGLSGKVTHLGHVRSLPPMDRHVASLLKDAGYYELPHKLWLQAPRIAAPQEVYEKYLSLQQDTGRLVEATGITILDPTRPVRYYKGRWRPATGTGHFVARREQRYGAPLWSFITLQNGQLTSLLDLPLQGTTLRGCDEAWWLQAAIDARNGTPQFAERVPIAGTDKVRLRFFGPLPRWAQRQLDAIGEPEPAKGALFSYAIPVSDLKFIQAFLAQHLWMTIVVGKGDHTAS